MPVRAQTSRWRSILADPIARIGFCAILPILIIELLSRAFATILRPVLPVAIDLSNFAALRHIFKLLTWNGNDSWLAMQQALKVLNGPHANALYETLFFGGHVRFQYPPTSLLPIAALSTVGLSGVHALNTINLIVFGLNAIGIGYFTWLTFDKFPFSSQTPMAEAGSRRMVLALLAAVVTFLFYPLVRAGVLGQIQLWIDLLFTVALILWVKQRRLASGILIGVACAIKPQLGVLMIWGLLWGERRFAGGILLGLLPIVAISLVLYGLHNHLEYLSVLSFLTKHGESYVANNSVNGILNWYLSPNDSMHWYDGKFTPYMPIVYFGTVIASVTFFALIIINPLLNRGRAKLSDLGAAAICTVAGSPVAWEHHYGILLPLFFVALRQAVELKAGRGRKVIFAIILASWILVADFIPFTLLLAHTPFAFVQASCFFGAVFLLGVLLTARHQQAQAHS